MLLCLICVYLRRKKTYRSLISMNVASKNHVNFIFNKPTLKCCSHAFSLHEVCTVTVIYWNMHQDNEPWRLFPIYPIQFISEPQPLRCVFHCTNSRKMRSLRESIFFGVKRHRISRKSSIEFNEILSKKKLHYAIYMKEKNLPYGE